MPVECDLNGWWPPGCGLVSQANDNALGAVTSLFANILQNMASWIWSFITGAFSVSDVDDSQWISIQGLTNWWVVVMMTPLVVVMILQLLSGLISQQPRRIGRAMLGGAAAIPLVGAAVYLVRQLTRASDLASAALLDSMGTDPYLVFMRLFGFERAPEGTGREWNVVSLAPGTHRGRSWCRRRDGDGRHCRLDPGLHPDVLDDLPLLRARRAGRRRPGCAHAAAVGQDEILGAAMVRDRHCLASRQASGRERSWRSRSSSLPSRSPSPDWQPAPSAWPWPAVHL